ncbi:LysM domain-containing protein [Kushneria phosphatilytica]|uniref:LysM peptidoglycan-binding domain-containing protein n=1 Tax=Kushneria phosphatilytica TaxID=657387 RepID=A0A1S1NQJ9_9GAMM|nr:LysM domain-containing protein [Kushneria phosphatilytica]OHV07773.1 hypothetical protein BH688_16465 [Kushneria phosphatilytica]QEL10277.1 LysM peptidoglycan-binding domain-containing protein [Kushneria phosphatilytica]
MGALLGLWLLQGPGLAAGDETYTVQPGDTLWDITERLEVPPWAWSSGDASEPMPLRSGDRVYRTTNGIRVERSEAPVVRLSPRLRQLAPREIVAPIPMASIRVWLTGHRIVEQCCDALPRVVSGEEGQLVSAAGQRILVRGVTGPRGRYYGIYAPGRAIRDEQGQVLGYSLALSGEARLDRVGSPLSVLTLTQGRREITAGDLLLPREARIPPENLQPHPLPAGVSGHIVADPATGRVIAAHDVITIDLGKQDGVIPGTVLGIYRTDPEVRDPLDHQRLALPSRQIGLALVFRSYQHAGYALVMHIDEPLSPGDRLAAPQT